MSQSCNNSYSLTEEDLDERALLEAVTIYVDLECFMLLGLITCKADG
jgi:hypothetical protein